ncbi:hypothetical protein FIV42_17010 [Persicimonas caeni]|uniref:4-vinyl reductase 4VR domain-containing protein n=1 Tax=Persicimonas caeni TaxID=2292766 RepID=A0A4Y6PW81_PERCE|nr:hypothetical protein [Persicimonas caeni]QDG52379.1 hypothetical protein FIV42_17010 [Persicimonas caeni]QED33601.1 hypothetical protein FRD00_17005 [Persicimonas caeni]
MEDFRSVIKWLDGHDFVFAGDTPVCSHCHHYNLFIDKTIDDALGVGSSIQLRTDAAREFFFQLLSSVFAEAGVDSPDERLSLAAEIFSNFGHGKIDLSQLNADGGEAIGEHMHYAYTWLEKFGDTQQRYHPADAVAGGFAAAALACAHDLAPEAVDVQETECLVLGDSRCVFELSIREVELSEPRIRVDYDKIAEVVPETFAGIQEETVERLTVGLKEFLANVSGDERGLIQAFGVFVTTNPSSLYNRISYEMLETLRREHPSFVAVSASLLREAGRLCGFNTFGGIIGSPEWEALTGSTERDMLTVALHACTIARGLGFGRWSVSDYEEGKMIAFQAPSTYEGPYYKIRHGVADDPTCYLFEGACEAAAQLGHAVDWSEQPDFTPAFYEDVFAPSNNPWRAEQTRCACKGDDRCEVVVTRTE